MSGKGPAEGGKTGTVRNEAKLCKATRANSDGQPCGNYALRGLEVCRRHGAGGEPGKQLQAKALAKQEVVAMAAELGLPTPVKPADFPVVAGEYVTRFNGVFARLEADLNEIRAMGIGEIAIARGYADILDRQQAVASSVTRMMQAAAALGISEAVKKDAQARQIEELATLMCDVMEALLAGLNLSQDQMDKADEMVPALLRQMSARAEQAEPA